MNDRWVVKSGKNFRELSFIEISVNEKQVLVDKIEKYSVDSKVEENIEIKSIVDSYLGDLNNRRLRAISVICA